MFSMDAMIHISDKAALFAEVYRVLRPGGFFSGCDWMRANEEPATPELERWLEIVGLTFELEPQEQYQAALEEAGFDMSPWSTAAPGRARRCATTTSSSPAPPFTRTDASSPAASCAFPVYGAREELSENFPVYSLVDREIAPETSSQLTARTTILSNRQRDR